MTFAYDPEFMSAELDQFVDCELGDNGGYELYQCGDPVSNKWSIITDSVFEIQSSLN